MNTRYNILTIDDVANSLNVSPATVKNWIKQEYLNPLKEYETLLFDVLEVDRLKSKIENSEVQRLSTRANKLNADKTFIPEEYLNNKSDIIKLNNLIAYIACHNLAKFDTYPKFSAYIICLSPSDSGEVYFIN